MPFALQMVLLAPQLLTGGQGLPTMSPEEETSLDAKQVFAEMSFDDTAGLWSCAGLVEACHYVRGGKALRCPADWKAVFPRAM